MVYPDKIIRSKRKSLSISVDAFGRLIVRAPQACSEERIFAFLSQKENWIRKKQAERAATTRSLPPENLDGYTFLLLGKPCKIRLTEEKNIRYDQETCVVYLPNKNARARLVKWLKENAERIFTQVTAQCAEKMQTRFQSVKINSAKTRWGCCTADNRIRYTFRLLYAPKEVIEYVVVHELSHIKRKDHSKRFWAEVEKYDPHWKAHRAWLKRNGILMEIF